MWEGWRREASPYPDLLRTADGWSQTGSGHRGRGSVFSIAYFEGCDLEFASRAESVSALSVQPLKGGPNFAPNNSVKNCAKRALTRFASRA